MAHSPKIFSSPQTCLGYQNEPTNIDLAACISSSTVLSFEMIDHASYSHSGVAILLKYAANLFFEPTPPFITCV